ncbi:MAG: response regulator transcription factor [bacterium]|nr:response regulator transcription factor [bacterium]
MSADSGHRILVVEDEEAIAHGLVFNLERKGHEVDLALDGEVALEKAGAGHYDLIVLDVALPKVDGFEVCQRLRRDGNFTAILILTARDQPDDVVYGLKTGADDYMVKPFDLAEFLARAEGLLRRAEWARSSAQTDATGSPGAEPDDTGSRFTFGPFWVDFKTWQAQTRDGQVELSRKEIAVIRVFAEKPNQVITRRELLDKVWELPNHPNTRVVDNVIVSLRKAFEENSWRPRHIHSVRGVGYRFVP